MVTVGIDLHRIGATKRWIEIGMTIWCEKTWPAVESAGVSAESLTVYYPLSLDRRFPSSRFLDCPQISVLRAIHGMEFRFHSKF